MWPLIVQFLAAAKKKTGVTPTWGRSLCMMAHFTGACHRPLVVSPLLQGPLRLVQGSCQTCNSWALFLHSLPVAPRPQALMSWPQLRFLADPTAQVAVAPGSASIAQLLHCPGPHNPSAALPSKRLLLLEFVEMSELWGDIRPNKSAGGWMQATFHAS